MILHTVTVKPLGNYRLYLTFNNGISGEVDLANKLWGEVFEPLKNPELFETAHQDELMKTVSWANGADFAPEFLMELMSQQYRQPARLISETRFFGVPSGRNTFVKYLLLP